MRLRRSPPRLCAYLTCIAHLLMSLEPLQSWNPDPAYDPPTQEQAALAGELGAWQTPWPA